jgi:hypothetical protein
MSTAELDFAARRAVETSQVVEKDPENWEIIRQGT